MTFFEFLAKANSETNGSPSSIRVNIFFMGTVFVLVVAFMSVYTTIKQPNMVVPIMSMLLGSILAAYGIKAIQKKDENPIEPGA